MYVIDRKVCLVPKFKEYDRDGNGYISLQEASMILQNKPFNFPADKVVVLLTKFDKDGNGKLDIDEFADFYAEAKATSVSVHGYKVDSGGKIEFESIRIDSRCRIE